MINAVAYCRVSTEKEDQLNSLSSQKTFFEEYCKNNNYNLIHTYADEGISGTKLKKRKEFVKLMEDANKGFFEIVLVKDISRFARNTVDFLQNIRTLKSLNIETMFLSSNMTVLGNSEFILTVFAAIAQEESSNTSKRIKFGKKINAEKGRVPNFVYGYDKTNGDYFSLTINAQESRIVRRIFDMYTQDGYGHNKIASILNTEGLRTKRGYKWSQPAVKRLLQNEIYTGLIINGKEEINDFLTGVRTNKEESEWFVKQLPELRIISDEQFKLAKDILLSRYDAFHIEKHRHSTTYLFSTIIRCEECGYTFRRFQTTYKNTYVRWGCSGRCINGADSCDNKIKIDEHELKLVLHNYFVDLLSRKKDVIAEIKKEFISVYKSKNKNVLSKAELTKELEKAKCIREKYIDMYAEDLISHDELKSKQKEIVAKIESIQSEISIAEFNLDKSEMLENVLKSCFETVDFVQSMDNITNTQLKKIIEKITVNKNGEVHIYLNALGELGLNEPLTLGTTVHTVVLNVKGLNPNNIKEFVKNGAAS